MLNSLQDKRRKKMMLEQGNPELNVGDPGVKRQRNYRGRIQHAPVGQRRKHHPRHSTVHWPPSPGNGFRKFNGEHGLSSRSI